MNRFLRNKSCLSLSVCLIVGSALRIWNFWKPSLWLDEFSTSWAVTSHVRVGDLAEKSVKYLLIPPTYFPLVKLSTILFGTSEFALRLPSVLAGMASIPLVYFLGKKTLSQEAGLMAAWCFAFHPWFINQSQDARAYALAICLALLSSIALWRVIETDRICDAVLLSLASAGLMHCQYIFTPFVVYQSLFWIWIILRSNDSASKRGMKLWFATQIMTLLLLAPAFRHLYQIWLWRNDFKYEIKIDSGYLTALVGPEIIILISLGLSLLIFFLFNWILRAKPLTFCFRGVKRERIYYFLLWFLLPWPFYLITWQLTGTSSLIVLRYFIIYLIPSCLLVGWFISSVHLVKLKPLWITFFLTLNFGLYLAPNFARSGLFSSDRHEDWRGLVRYLDANSPNGPKVLLKSGQIVADLILQPDGRDAVWKDVIRSPFGDFYVKSNWPVVDLPYHWKTGLADDYFRMQVVPFVHSDSEFWLVARKDHESEGFLRSLREAIIREGVTASRETLYTERFGVILIHFEK